MAVDGVERPAVEAGGLGAERGLGRGGVAGGGGAAERGQRRGLALRAALALLLERGQGEGTTHSAVV